MFVDKVEEMLLDSWHLKEWSSRIINFFVDLLRAFITIIKGYTNLPTLKVVNRLIFKRAGLVKSSEDAIFLFVHLSVILLRYLVADPLLRK